MLSLAMLQHQVVCVVISVAYSGERGHVRAKQSLILLMFEWRKEDRRRHNMISYSLWVRNHVVGLGVGEK